MNKLGTKLGAVAMSAVMALSFAPSAAITSLAAGGDDLTDATQLSVPVYRLYNPNSGEHLFTTNENECDSLDKNGWDYETIAWYAPSTGDPVFRLYNPNHPLGDHHYTSSEEERDNLIKQGWKLDATAFNTVAEGELLGAPVYSLYNPNAYDLGMATHHLTLSEEEADGLELLGWTNEGPKFYEYAEDLDPEVEELTVSIDNTTPKVGDTIRVLIHDEDGNEVNPEDVDAEIQWYQDGDKIIGETDADLYVTSDMVGDVLSVIVTIDDVEYTDETDEVKTIAAEVTIYDIDGFQEDGTALSGDTLAITYGAELGTPQSITWYVNDVVAQMNDFTGAAATLRFTPEVKDASAEVYAIVINKNGEQYKSSNTITVTSEERPVEVFGMDIEDDYSTPANVSYSASDAMPVVTISLSKDVPGTFYIYDGKATKFSTTAVAKLDLTESVVDTAIAAATGTTGKTNVHEYQSIASMTAKNALAIETARTTNGLGSAIKYTNADGSVTYMFQPVTGREGKFTQNLTRGSEYKIAFDQEGIKSDDISAQGRTDIDCTEPVAVPYLTAPAKLEITSAGAAAGAIKVAVEDADGTVLSWMGNNNGITANGFASATVYNVASKTTTGGTSALTGTNLVAGDKGVFTSNLAASTSSGNYWYVVAKTTAGIFGKDAIEITSAEKETNSKIADKVVWAEDSAEAANAKITFTNLAADATVYLYADMDTSGATVGTFDPDSATTYRASVAVSKGDKEAALSGVFVADDITRGTEFTAIIVPNDETEYSRLADSNTSRKLSDKPTTMQYTKTAATFTPSATATVASYTITDTGLVAYNQFGNKVTSASTGNAITGITVTDKDITTGERATATYDVAATTGQVTINVEAAVGATNAIDKGDGFSLPVLGTTVTLMSTYKATLKANADVTGCVVKIGDTELYKDANYAKLAALTYTLGTVNTTTGKQTITISGTDGTITAVDGSADQSKYSAAVSGRIVTVSYVATGAETVAVTLTLGGKTRTLTFAYASAATVTDMTTAELQSDVYA